MKKTFTFITLLLTAAVSYAQPQLNKNNIDEVVEYGIDLFLAPEQTGTLRSHKGYSEQPYRNSGRLYRRD